LPLIATTVKKIAGASSNSRIVISPLVVSVLRIMSGMAPKSRACRCMRPGRRNVLRVAIAETAHSAERGHTLLEGGKAAVRAAAHVAAAVFCAPRVVLCVRAAAECSGADDNAKREKQ
jgi:hypothetical protein